MTEQEKYNALNEISRDQFESEEEYLQAVADIKNDNDFEIRENYPVWYDGE